MTETKDEKGYIFLSQPRRIRNKIYRLEQQKEALEFSLLPGAIRYDKPNVKHSPEDTMAKIMARIDEIERTIAESKSKLGTVSIDISDAIEEKLDDDNERTVLTAYFINSQSMEYIAEQMNYSTRQTYRFWKRGIQNISDTILSEMSDSEDDII